MIIIIIPLLVVMLIFFWRYLKIETISEPIVRYSEIKDSLKTGDILSVSYDNINGFLVRLFSGSSYIHTGLVLRNENGVYVLESGFYKNKRGIMLSPLNRWIGKNSKIRISYSSLIGPGLDSKRLLDVYEKTKECDINMFVVSWMQTLIKTKYKEQNKKSYFCSEYVCYCLQELGVVEKIHKPGNYTPNDILFGRIPMSNEYCYMMPVKIGVQN